MRTGSDPNPYFFMMHICIPNHVKYMDWFLYMNCNSVKSLKLLHLYFSSV
jgi:hypothetical protein